MTASTAFALAVQTTPTGGAGSMMPFIIEIALIFVFFYFIVMRPQQKQRKQHEQSLRELKKGDEVVTAGGIVGEVIHIRETVKDGSPAPTMEDRITIKSAESRLVVERGRIARVGSKTSEASPVA
jgi:preprotein translocase subunit YajC